VEKSGIPDLADLGKVRIIPANVYGGGVSADSHSNLLDNVFLYDDIAEIDELAEVEESAVMPVMSVMPVMPSTHGVEFRIDQFTHFIPSLRRHLVNHTEGRCSYL
jgi:hypothetical protein